MVDVELFAEVEARLASRTKQGIGRHRRRRELHPLTPVCAACGNEYNGGRNKKEQGSTRQYTHVNPKARAHPVEHDRMHGAQCLVFNGDAQELEATIKDIIVRERSSTSFEQEVREIIAARDASREHALHAMRAALHKYKIADSACTYLARTWR